MVKIVHLPVNIFNLTKQHWINQFNHSGIGAKSNFLGQNISGLFYIAKNPAKMTTFNDLSIAK